MTAVSPCPKRVRVLRATYENMLATCSCFMGIRQPVPCERADTRHHVSPYVPLITLADVRYRDAPKGCQVPFLGILSIFERTVES